MTNHAVELPPGVRALWPYKSRFVNLNDSVAAMLRANTIHSSRNAIYGWARYRIELKTRHNQELLVEAGGIEPPSEDVQELATTRLFRDF